MQRHDPWPAHEQFARAAQDRVPDRLRRDPLVQQIDDGLARFVGRRLPERREQVGRGRRVGLAVEPVVANLLGQLAVLAAWPIGGVVGLRRVHVAARHEGIGQRAVNRLGILPADRAHHSPGVGGEDDLVADRSEIARGVVPEQFGSPRRPLPSAPGWRSLRRRPRRPISPSRR